MKTMTNERIEITPEFLKEQGFSPTFPKRFWKKVVIHPGACWEWTACKTSFGYGLIRKNTNHRIDSHRASWFIHYGPIENGQWVLHKCHNPQCTNPDHLYLGDRNKNVRDMMEVGHGDNGSKKLTPEQATKIRSLGGTMLQREIGKQFGIDQSAVSRILNHKAWKYGISKYNVKEGGEIAPTAH